MGIHTATGDRVATIFASDESTVLDRIPQQGVISCRIPCLPLKAGRYQIRAIAYCGVEVADHPSDAVGLLDVESGDFFTNGRQPRDRSNAPLLLRSQWSVAPHESASSSTRRTAPAWGG